MLIFLSGQHSSLFSCQKFYGNYDDKKYLGSLSNGELSIEKSVWSKKKLCSEIKHVIGSNLDDANGSGENAMLEVNRFN